MVNDDITFGIVTLDLMKLAKDPKSIVVNIVEKKEHERVLD